MNEINEKYSWDPEKRESNIKKRGLDFVLLADHIFADPNVVIEPDVRCEYGEERFLAYALVEETRLCLCFALRDGRIHLITVFKMNKKQWEAHYGRNS